MPFILPALSRRRFLAASAAAAASLAARGLAADAKHSPLVALLGDTHIAADRATVLREVNMADHLQEVVGQIVKAREPGTFAILHGDAAMLKGEAGDYKTAGELLAPLSAAGLNTYVLLGNHDNRAQFREALADYSGARPQQRSALEAKYALHVQEFPQAHWFTLDSLDKTNVTPGRLGDEQLAWLAKSLDARTDKPAIISVHHHPYFQEEKNGGILDTKALFEVLTPRRQVKAVVFGHTHDWHIAERDGIQLINLPPVAYVFGKGKPSGWVEARLGQDDSGKGKLSLTLHALHGHQQDGEEHDLPLRS